MRTGQSPPPQNLSYAVQEHGLQNSIIVLEWEYPEQMDVDSYTITVTGCLEITFPTIGDVRTSLLTLPYNEDCSVSITATNCMENSEVSTLDYFQGKIIILYPLVLFHVLIPGTSIIICSCV